MSCVDVGYNDTLEIIPKESLHVEGLQEGRRGLNAVLLRARHMLYRRMGWIVHAEILEEALVSDHHQHSEDPRLADAPLWSVDRKEEDNPGLSKEC